MQKLTSEELQQIFGPTMPLEAAVLMMNPPEGWTIDDVRAKLREIAEKKFVDIQVKPK